MKRTKQQAEETKQLILDTSLKLFNKWGYSATSIAMIIKATKTSKGAIYWHFSSKKEIIESLLNTFALKYFTEIEKLTKANMLPLQLVQKYINVHFDLYEQDETMKQLIELVLLKLEYTDEFKDLLIKMREIDTKIYSMLTCFLQKLHPEKSMAEISNYAFIIDSFILGSLQKLVSSCSNCTLNMVKESSKLIINTIAGKQHD